MSRARSGVRLSMAALVLFITACSGGASTLSDSMPAPALANMQLPPCDTPPFYAVAAAYQTDSVEQYRLRPLVSGSSLSTNEAHDCQRLIYADTGKLHYGPLVALLVSIDSVERAQFIRGVVVAEIVNYTGPAYAPLGIRPGFSCLWLQGDPASTVGWSARIISSPATPCTDITGSADPALVVHRVQHGDTVYPSTGRWMWDHNNNRQFIGMRCGRAWCDIGIAGFPRTPVTGLTVETVPGWSDEQYLAHYANDQLRVSGLFGTIRPSAALHAMSATQISAGLTTQIFPETGMHVADISLQGNDREALRTYGEKFMIPCECMTRIPLYVRPRTISDGRRIHEFSTSPLFGANWRSMRQSYKQHAGRRAVRWAWDEEDEAAWVSCEDGCCRTDEGII